MAKKQPTSPAPPNVLQTSGEIWDFLIQNGFKEDGYDEGLVVEVCNTLGLDSTKPVRTQLHAGGVSTRRLVETFLAATAPYAHLMTDLCAFFERHGVAKTNRAMRIRLELGESQRTLAFDLDHFREAIRMWDETLQEVYWNAWNHDALWQLWHVFEEWHNWNDAPVHLQDFEQRWQRGDWPDPPAAPAADDSAAQGTVALVWELVADVMTACRTKAPNHDELKKRGFSSRAPLDAEAHDGTVPRERWDLLTLARITSDHWQSTLLRAVTWWAEAVAATPPLGRAAAAAQVVGKVAHIISQLPQRKGQQRGWRDILQDILSLPSWQFRHELYSAWMLTQLDAALAPYDIAVHHNQGELLLKFSGTHVATGKSVAGPIYVAAEIRTPNPAATGHGRTGNIQPDYRICRDPALSAASTQLVLECKQYKKASARNFGEALTDYASGCPDALIILVNYGPAPQALLERVPKALRSRVRLFGPCRPDQPVTLQALQAAIRSALPAPVAPPLPPSLSGAVHGDTSECDTVCVDISSSMSHYLKRPDVEAALLSLVQRPVRLLAVGNSLVMDWQGSPGAVRELLTTNWNEGTDLPCALAQARCDPSRTFVITDDDGAAQLRNAGLNLRGMLDCSASQ